MKITPSIIILLIISTLIGCQKTTQPIAETLSTSNAAPQLIDEPSDKQTNQESITQTITPTPEWIACPQRRAEVCAQIYKPVCATLDTQARCVTTPCPSQTTKTFSNSCMACANRNVTGFIDGACTSGSTKISK